MNKEQIRQELMDAANSDLNFLINTLGGMDILNDALLIKLKKLTKPELLELLDEARRSQADYEERISIQ